MKLKIGNRAPDFTLPSSEGEMFRLSENLGEGIILYFYPKDFTGGCTAEACSFRDEIEHFEDLDIRVVGISTDDVDVHNRFINKYNLPFTLLSDTDGTVSKTYDSLIPFIGLSKRVTYLIDSEQKIVQIYNNALMAKNHIKEMKKAGLQLKSKVGKTP